MKISRSASLFATLSILASALVGINVANAAGNPNCDAVDGDYIVSFVPGANVESEIKRAPGRAIATKFKYTKALNGFAANLSAEQVCAFQKRPNVQFVEQDAVVSIDQIDQPGATWGLDRIDQTEKIITSNSYESYYSYTNDGSGVTAYIIDTGIYTANADFGDRAEVGRDTLGGNGQDCNGHGTHVAGTVGGTNYGVAKSVNLVAVRVLNCRGSGTTTSVVAGIEWVISNHLEANSSDVNAPAVANMSLGGGISDAIDAAVTNLIGSGVVTVVAAGNSTKNVSTSSPARVADAITVAASDKNDVFAWFSNYGPGVDLIAPGVNITSDWILSKRAPSLVNTMSGTSMAAPHVAGLVARYLQSNPKSTPSITRDVLVGLAALNKITSVPTGTPNLLIYANPTK